MDGVLKSWAVPKGPSGRAEEKRLAVHVEDHPLEYADFEGTIPEGNYGAGAVIVWDRGWYRTFKDDDLAAQYARGKLELEFFGYKMQGRWTLVRMSKSEKDWLFLKKADASAAGQELVDRYPRSVVSGLTVEQIRDPAAVRATVAEQLRSLGAPRGDVRAQTQPFMLATLAKHPPAGDDWLFEIKYDGVRALAERRGEVVAIFGRNGQPITPRYPEIVDGLRALPFDRFVLDGEIIAVDSTGRPSFHRLQARMGLRTARDAAAARRVVPVTGVFFDCLALEGHDLRTRSLLRRKECLMALLPPLGAVHYSDHVVGHGPAFFEAAGEQRLEGVLAKKAMSPYTAARSGDWLKIKCHRRQEFVIGGYTDPQGSRGHFGALHLGLHADQGLIYVSKVGAGFDQAALRQIWDALQPLRRDAPPFVHGVPGGRGHHWVEPSLVCEVRFGEWTPDGGIRHPTFVGLRPDKRPEDCRREEAGEATVTAVSEAAPEARTPGAGRRRAPDAGSSASASGPTAVTITNPQKVFWPEEGYTKADLIAYYDAVAPLLLPYLKERPLVLTRYPDGIGGKSFFQKDAPDFVPSWVRTERIYSKDADREINYFIANDAETLRYIVNLGTIPLHLWSAHLGSLDLPDWLVLDLDPKGAPFADVVRVARELHRILDDVGLAAFVKTSGSTGLHILVPLGAAYSYEDTRTFARLIGLLALEASPDLATLARPIRSRGGKVYVDYVQNGHGRTIVAPFSVRPLPGAPVSCPLGWDEVNARLDPTRFTIMTIPRRFAQMRDPMTGLLEASIDMAGAITRIERRLHRGTARR
jgi:bifunctional non-homologous end joining protein LigD